MSKNFDETICLQSEKNDGWIQEVREKDYKELQRTRVVLPVWPAHQLRRFPEETSVQGPIVS